MIKHYINACKYYLFIFLENLFKSISMPFLKSGLTRKSEKRIALFIWLGLLLAFFVFLITKPSIFLTGLTREDGFEQQTIPYRAIVVIIFALAAYFGYFYIIEKNIGQNESELAVFGYLVVFMLVPIPFFLYFSQPLWTAYAALQGLVWGLPIGYLISRDESFMSKTQKVFALGAIGGTSLESLIVNLTNAQRNINSIINSIVDLVAQLSEAIVAAVRSEFVNIELHVVQAGIRTFIFTILVLLFFGILGEKKSATNASQPAT